MTTEILDFKIIETNVKGYCLLQWDFDSNNKFARRSIQIETEIAEYFVKLHKLNIKNRKEIK